MAMHESGPRAFEASSDGAGAAASAAWAPGAQRTAGAASRRVRRGGTLTRLAATLAEATASLGKNRVRTSLATLGIVIGIASVITMVAVGEGSRLSVEREIAAMGDDWMFIGSWGIQRQGVQAGAGVSATMTTDDAVMIMQQCSYVRAATPSNRITMQVASSYANYQTSVIGVFPTFFDIRRWQCDLGRPFNEDDNATLAKVCCIGQTAARELFGSVDPVGETIRVNRVPFKIIGRLAAKGRSSDGRDYDDCMVFPFRTFQTKVAGQERSATLLAAARAGVPMPVVREQVRQFLRERHRLGKDDPDDFRIFDLAENAEAKEATTRIFSNLLLAIASISLVVGGVGIMNIMLVSVTERTREIGLRMAIGADGARILGQFLIEAVLLCCSGGVVGVLLALIAAQVLNANGWECVVTTWSLFVAVLFSLLVGVFFGFYPAWRASRLDPIEALRYE
ncbi:MAG: ABC transporter permease [Phycisphaerae bacterium]